MKIYLFLLIFINIIFVYNKTVSSRKTNYIFKQEAHGPYRSPEKTVQKSLNKYDNIKTLIQRIKKKLYENLWVLHLNKLESPSPKDALCQVWLKLVQWFWIRRFKNFSIS